MSSKSTSGPIMIRSLAHKDQRPLYPITAAPQPLTRGHGPGCSLPTVYVTLLPLRGGRALQIKHKDPKAVQKAIDKAIKTGEGHVSSLTISSRRSTRKSY